MQALVVEPGRPHSARIEDVPEPRREPGTVLLRPLEVGVCGTDREIAEGLFGIPPEGSERLVLGHEVLARVEEDAEGFARGDLVAATVRRSCGRCAACAQGSPDACETGLYVERGITRLDGFASELVAEAADQLVPVPQSLGRLGVLGEPASICERALRHVRAIGGRQPWAPRRALVLGAGAIGMLATTFLRLEDFEVWTAARGPADSLKGRLVADLGARYVSVADTSPTALAEETGGFDIVIEAAGDAQTMLDTIGLLRRNGVACLLGIDGRPQQVTIDGQRHRPGRGRSEPRPLRQRERASRRLAGRGRGARPRPGALAGGAGGLRRPPRSARRLRGGLRLPRRQGDAAVG